jgi:NAD+ diphosphatase
MVGFTADYDVGEIAIDAEEIVAARWFTVDQLPSIPGPISIARRLIDSFIQKQRNGR